MSTKRTRSASSRTGTHSKRTKTKKTPQNVEHETKRDVTQPQETTKPRMKTNKTLDTTRPRTTTKTTTKRRPRRRAATKKILTSADQPSKTAKRTRSSKGAGPRAKRRADTNSTSSKEDEMVNKILKEVESLVTADANQSQDITDVCERIAWKNTGPAPGQKLWNQVQSSIKSKKKKKSKKTKASKTKLQKFINLDKGTLASLAQIRVGLQSTGVWGSKKQTRSFLAVAPMPFEVIRKPESWTGPKYYVQGIITDHTLAKRQLGVRVTVREKNESTAELICAVLNKLTAGAQPFLLVSPPFFGVNCDVGFEFQGLSPEDIPKRFMTGPMKSSHKFYQKFVEWHAQFKEDMATEHFPSTFSWVTPRNGYSNKINSLSTVGAIKKLFTKKKGRWQHVRVACTIKEFHANPRKELMQYVCAKKGHWKQEDCTCDDNVNMRSRDPGLEMTVTIKKETQRFAFMNANAVTQAVRLSSTFLAATEDSDMVSAICMERSRTLKDTAIEITLLVNPKKTIDTYGAKIVSVHFKDTAPECLPRIERAMLDKHIPSIDDSDVDNDDELKFEVPSSQSSAFWDAEAIDDSDEEDDAPDAASDSDIGLSSEDDDDDDDEDYNEDNDDDADVHVVDDDDDADADDQSDKDDEREDHDDKDLEEEFHDDSDDDDEAARDDDEDEVVIHVPSKVPDEPWNADPDDQWDHPDDDDVPSPPSNAAPQHDTASTALSLLALSAL